MYEWGFLSPMFRFLHKHPLIYRILKYKTNPLCSISFIILFVISGFIGLHNLKDKKISLQLYLYSWFL